MHRLFAILSMISVLVLPSIAAGEGWPKESRAPEIAGFWAVGNDYQCEARRGGAVGSGSGLFVQYVLQESGLTAELARDMLLPGGERGGVEGWNCRIDGFADNFPGAYSAICGNEFESAQTELVFSLFDDPDRMVLERQASTTGRVRTEYHSCRGVAFKPTGYCEVRSVSEHTRKYGADPDQLTIRDANLCRLETRLCDQRDGGEYCVLDYYWPSTARTVVETMEGRPFRINGAKVSSISMKGPIDAEDGSGGPLECLENQDTSAFFCYASREALPGGVTEAPGDNQTETVAEVDGDAETLEGQDESTDTLAALEETTDTAPTSSKPTAEECLPGLFNEAMDLPDGCLPVLEELVGEAEDTALGKALERHLARTTEGEGAQPTEVAQQDTAAGSEGSDRTVPPAAEGYCTQTDLALAGSGSTPCTQSMTPMQDGTYSLYYLAGNREFSFTSPTMSLEDATLAGVAKTYVPEYVARFASDNNARCTSVKNGYVFCFSDSPIETRTAMIADANGKLRWPVIREFITEAERPSPIERVVASEVEDFIVGYDGRCIWRAFTTSHYYQIDQDTNPGVVSPEEARRLFFNVDSENLVAPGVEPREYWDNFMAGTVGHQRTDSYERHSWIQEEYRALIKAGFMRISARVGQLDDGSGGTKLGVEFIPSVTKGFKWRYLPDREEEQFCLPVGKYSSFEVTNIIDATSVPQLSAYRTAHFDLSPFKVAYYKYTYEWAPEYFRYLDAKDRPHPDFERKGYAMFQRDMVENNWRALGFHFQNRSDPMDYDELTDWLQDAL